MKNLTSKELLFRSEDIKILFYEGSPSEKFSNSDMIESRLSFNLFFFLGADINLEVQDFGTKFSFQKNQYILHYSPNKIRAQLWTENHQSLKYVRIEIAYHYVLNLINPVPNKESEVIMKNMIRNNYIFLHKQTPPYITVEMHMILKEIISYSKKGTLQKLFIEVKIIKLLMLIFEQFIKKTLLRKLLKFRP